MKSIITNAESLQKTATLGIDQALQQAIAHHKAGELQDAERLYRAILQAQPNHPDANHNLGVLAVQVKQPVVGLPHFKAALEANPNQGQYWLSYIDTLLQTGQTDVARQELEQARQRGLNGEAVEVLAGRLVIPSESEPSLQEMHRLVALFTGGRYTEVATLAQAMTERFPLHGFGWKALGTVFKRMGQSADALAPLQKAAALTPDDAEGHYNLGVTLQELGRLTAAEASFIDSTFRKKFLRN